MTYKITVLYGDGIGHEIVPAAQRVVEATGIKVEWENMPAGELAVEKYGEPVPPITLESIKKNKIAIKGPLTNMVARGYPSPNLTLRNKLGLFAAVKRARYFEGVPSPFKNVDLIVVREATEDTYAGVEQKIGPDAAVAFKFITRATTHRVTRFTMELARKMGRRKVTVTHKANILKLTDGLFLEGAREIAKEFPDIEFNDYMIDNMAYQLVKNPVTLDVILAPNVYGDILADLIAGVAGSLGLGFGGNFGSDVALFEPIHGTAPGKAGKGTANPIGVILSAAMMLDYLGENAAAKAVESAVAKVLLEGKTLTGDLGGNATLDQITNAIINSIKYGGT